MNNKIHFKVVWLIAITFMLSFQVLLAQGVDSSGHSFDLQGDPIDTLLFCSPPPLIETGEENGLSGLGNSQALWEVGQTVRVKFLDGSMPHRNKVKEYATQWEDYANITLQFVENGDAEIRISFEQKGAFYSRVGTKALQITSQKNPTMNLGFRDNELEASYRRLILHEFGHALGLEHEHQHPESNIQWNKPVVYEYFETNYGWPQSQVDFNLFEQFSDNLVHYCTYDPSSIMHYFVLNIFTFNNFSVGNNSKLSPEDKSFIQNLYPDSGVRADPICQDNCTNCETDFTLTTTAQGQGSITISPASGSNDDCTSSCSGTYMENQEVRLRAVPKSGYQFVRWSGTRCDGSVSTSCGFKMTMNHSVTAIFEAVIPSRQLTIETQGKGNVTTRVDNTIRGVCANVCNYTFNDRAGITLIATPMSGYRFSRWEGGDCSNNSNTTCSFNIDENRKITAIFEAIVVNKTLAVSVEGNGSITTKTGGVTRDICANTCNYTFSEGTTIEVSATPMSGYRFVKWENGTCNNNTNITCSFVLSENLMLHAIFERIPPANNQVRLQIIGSGKVVTTDNTTAQICDKDCTLSYPPNSMLELWAQADEGYRFDKWVGTPCDQSTLVHCDLMLNNSQNIMALFEPIGTEASCLEFTASPTNTICKAVSIRVTKGTAPFDLKVNGPITGEATTSNKSFRLEDLPAGTYDITLEDAAGCETTEQFTIDANCGQGSLTDRSTSRSRILEDQVTDLTTPLVLLQHISNTRSPEETPIATRFTTQQKANTNSYSGKRRCGTTQLMEDLLQDPAAAQQYQEKKQMAYSGMMQAREDCDQKQVLPIAIHFQGIANPNRACLANLARRQIETLNEDIQARNKEIDTWKTEVYKYFPNTNYGSTCLEFCIATKNHPAGYGLRDGDLALTINRTKGDFDRNWSGYINIFVREIDLLGYSPVGGSGNGDGIVLDVSAFGRGTSCGSVRPTSPYNLGRTLTHEIGHYLLLNHIWGDGCDTDDRLPDTPDAAAPNYGCPPLGVASCGSADLHVNYMDYTDDACLYMFTRLQSSLMEFYVDRFLSNVTSNSSRVCETEETIEQTNSMVVQISGKGSVEINSGDNSSTCNLICSSPFQTGTNMRLMAKAATGYRFVEWEGASCSASSNENCSFTLNENVIIKAIFEAIPATVKNLQIEVIGKGTIESTVNNTMETCRNSCTFKYPQNSSLSLVAKPDAGYRFNKWLESTCNATTSSTCEMMLTGDQRLIAIFEEAATVDDPCILFTATPTPSICNAVSIKITEGVAPFDLTIKGPITGEARTSNKAFRLQDLPAGTYTATLTDAEACEATEQFIIDPNCGQSLTNPVSTSRSITDNTEHVLDLTIQEVATVSRLINNFPPPCLSLPLDYMPSPSDVPSSTSTISRLWDVGQIITVKFLGGDDRELKEKIIQGAREWEKYANITFRFITTGPARIRISFKEAGNYSRIGSDADKIDQEEETMNFFFLDYETDRRIEAVILHEFGHALGLLHEHVHPKNTIQWNKQAVYDYNPNLSTELVDLIYFDLPAQDEVYFCEYDPASVMHYGVDPAHTLNNFSVSPNNLMSQEDKRFIGKLYPFSGVRSELGIGFCSDEPISTDTNKELKIRVKGEGSVVVKAAGTTNTCQRSCTFIYANNLNFQLKAMPQSGYRFVKWSGKYCTNSPLLDCQMNINTNETITAYFEPISNENSCLVFGVTPSNSTCNRGKISIAITAGIAPFKLNLTGPISGDATTNNKSFRLEDLAAGAYTITIKDGAGCESTQAFSIANTCVNAPTSATSSSRSTLRITDESIISEEIEEVRITVGANYPNPFRERTILPFNLVKDGAVQLDIFHSNGQRVYQSTQVLEAGQHQIELGPKELQQAGLYIYHLRVAKEVVTGKMIRL